MELLNKGFILMILGMGMVFLFLIALIFVMNFIRMIAEKFEAKASTEDTTMSSAIPDNKVNVAIATAVAFHLKNKGNSA